MSFFDRFRKAAPDRGRNDEPNNPQYITLSTGNKAQVITYSDVVNAAEAMRHPIISRCVDVIAKAVQSVSWYAEEDPDATPAERTGKARVIRDLNNVLRSPNDRMSGPTFRFWMAQNYALYARVPFSVGQSVSETANGLYPLNAKFVQAILSASGQVQQYEYGNGNDAQKFPLRRDAKGKPYVYEISKPNLDGSTTGNGTTAQTCNPTLSAIAMPAAIMTVLLRRAYDTASGHPNCKYIVVAEKTLTAKQKESLGKELENMEPGQEESGNVLILYNQGKVQIEKLDNSLADIHSKVPMDDMTRMIAGSFGIPIALVGIGAADAAKFAGNYAESRRVFWADTIIPGYLVPFAEGMTNAICPDGVRIRFDLDSIDALRDHNISNAKDLEIVTFLSNDEKRELTGFAPTGEKQNTAVPSKQAAVSATPPAS
jgi:phage portal protein BeeE